MGLFGKRIAKPVELRGGGQLKCQLCGCAEFFDHTRTLAVHMQALFGSRIECCACAECGYVHWFVTN